MKDGTSRKIPRDRAEELLKSGEVKRYISGTIYRAMQLGIEVKNFSDRDESGKLRAQIRAIREKADQERAKKEKPKASSEKKRQLPTDKKNEEAS
jgi:hypothetical protein